MNEILTTIIQAIIIPAIPVLIGYFVKFINSKSAELASKTENARVKAYLAEATDAVTQAVTYTTQTYVDALKKQGSFDAEAQRKAFNASKDVALNLLTKEAKEMITLLYGDVSLWLDTKIEQTIKEQKSLTTELISDQFVIS